MGLRGPMTPTDRLFMQKMGNFVAYLWVFISVLYRAEIYLAQYFF